MRFLDSTVYPWLILHPASGYILSMCGGVIVVVGLVLEMAADKEWFQSQRQYESSKKRKCWGERFVIAGVILETILALVVSGKEHWQSDPLNRQAKSIRATLSFTCAGAQWYDKAIECHGIIIVRDTSGTNSSVITVLAADSATPTFKPSPPTGSELYDARFGPRISRDANRWYGKIGTVRELMERAGEMELGVDFVTNRFNAVNCSVDLEVNEVAVKRFVFKGPVALNTNTDHLGFIHFSTNTESSVIYP